MKRRSTRGRRSSRHTMRLVGKPASAAPADKRPTPGHTRRQGLAEHAALRSSLTVNELVSTHMSQEQ